MLAGFLSLLRPSAGIGTGLQLAHRYDGDVPGWGGLASNDQFLPADITGDGKTDLFAYNTQDWATEYLGRMTSSGNALAADFGNDLPRRILVRMEVDQHARTRLPECDGNRAADAGARTGDERTLAIEQPGRCSHRIARYAVATWPKRPCCTSLIAAAISSCVFITNGP